MGEICQGFLGNADQKPIRRIAQIRAPTCGGVGFGPVREQEE